MATVINRDHPVYISYSWDNEDNPGIERDVKPLCKLMEEKGIAYLYDKGENDHQLMRWPDSIPDAEDIIGRGDFVIVIFSKKYLTSPHCMYEWHKIVNSPNKNYNDRIIPIILPGTFEEFGGTDINVNVKRQFRDLELKSLHLKWDFEDGHSESTPQRALRENVGQYKADLEILGTYMQDTIKRGYSEIVDNNYSLIIDALSDRIWKSCGSEFDPNGNDLIDRPDDRKKLRDAIFRNTFVNLQAMGGSGKSSLVKLLSERNKNDFNEIRYTLVNSSLYTDVFDEYKNIELEDGKLPEAKTRFNKYVEDLQKTPANGNKFNLWIIDINESSNYKEIEETLKLWTKKSYIHLWKNWRILVVSRVLFLPVGTIHMATMENNPDVLNKIFFHYLDGDSVSYYRKAVESGKLSLGEDFFKLLFNLPILVEHLSRYLSDAYSYERVGYPDTESIYKLLGVDDKKREASRKFFEVLSANNSAAFQDKDKEAYETVGSYLKNIVTFDKLRTEDIKTVARHFMLFNAEYIPVADIKALVGEDNCSDWRETLKEMVNSKFLDPKHDDKTGTVKYKMHGLIADALRGQIFNPEDRHYVTDDKYRDFSKLRANILNFRKYSDELESCFCYCFVDDKRDNETDIVHPSDEFDKMPEFLNAEFYKVLADKIYNTSLYEKWYKLKLIEEVCGIEDHTQKLKKYQEYKDKSSHKVYEENYTPSQGNEIDQDLKNEVFSQMVELKAGNFDMGGNGKYDGRPIHNVTISNSFYIGKYPVTQKLWKCVMDSLPDDSDYDSDRFRGDRKPVIDVNWYDCMDFIIKLNATTGLQFRLPTEAEWEYACRCSGVDKYKLDDVAWYYDNSGRQLHEVGTTKKSSELAIQDMLGNVWEWCSDWAGSYSDEPQVDPQGPSMGSSRVNRGGGWFNDGGCCRVAYRNDGNPCYRVRDYHVGFRLAVSLQFKK